MLGQFGWKRKSTMSKHMQLTITVRPYYKQGLDVPYPKLARHLSYLAPELAASNPSLYELAGQLDQLLQRVEGTTLGEVLLRHREPLVKAYKNIEENIADWKLAQADRLLYEIEDVFDAVESELD
jgi:hypothetical protein